MILMAGGGKPAVENAVVALALLWYTIRKWQADATMNSVSSERIILNGNAKNISG